MARRPAPVDGSHGFTLVQHPDRMYGTAGTDDLKSAFLLVVPVPTESAGIAIDKAGGEVFKTYDEAADLLKAAEAYAREKGGGELAGYCTSKVGLNGLDVYVPVRRAVY